MAVRLSWRGGWRGRALCAGTERMSVCLASQLQPSLKKAQAASGGEDNGVCPTATWPSASQCGV